MDRAVKVYNDGELVFEGRLQDFLNKNKEDKDFILSQINFKTQKSVF